MSNTVSLTTMSLNRYAVASRGEASLSMLRLDRGGLRRERGPIVGPRIFLLTTFLLIQ
jgi:hypothetical protein